ncbi:MAG TPA: hypothetical protein VK619_07185 [Pyrinomonadaceae bacterium]|nr:hypothetical protein [Pyrinomonadaceae bacterium]
MIKRLTLLTAVLLLLSFPAGARRARSARSSFVSKPRSIRQVDFRNFTYKLNTLPPIRVRNGRHKRRNDDDFDIDGVEIAYGDLTGDRRDEAVIIVRSSAGGTGYFSNGFVYTLRHGRPVLLTEFDGGDRAQGGIESAKVRRGLLIVERAGGEGLCCPEYVEITEYGWDGARLVQNGAVRRRELRQSDPLN